MELQLPPAIAEKYAQALDVPCNPSTIAGRLIDFETISEQDAEWLVSIGCPHLVKKELPIKVDNTTKSKLFDKAVKEIKQEDPSV